MEKKVQNKVIVVGAGIGGLAAALSLLKRGIDVEIYEQAAELEGGRRRHPDQLQRHPRALRARSGRGAEARAGAAAAPRDPAPEQRRDLELVRSRRDNGAALRHAACDAAPGRPARAPGRAP